MQPLLSDPRGATWPQREATQNALPLSFAELTADEPQMQRAKRNVEARPASAWRMAGAAALVGVGLLATVLLAPPRWWATLYRGDVAAFSSFAFQVCEWRGAAGLEPTDACYARYRAPLLPQPRSRAPY